MAEDKQRDTLVAISALILVLAALGVNIYQKTALEGLRPVAAVKEAPEKVQARLWQDPLAAVLDYVQSGAAKQEVLQTDLCPWTGDPGFMMQESVAPSALRHRLAEVRQGGVVTILGVMVVGGPYAEETESRIRQRVAVLAALERLGYVPEDAEHVNFIRLTTVDKAASRTLRLANILPYEWLAKDLAPQDKLLLLWLNEDSFQTQPLTRLACLRRYLQPPVGPQKKETPYVIIGPATSGTLETMIKELWQAGSEAHFPKGMRLFAAATTVSNYLLAPLRVDPKFTLTRAQWMAVEKDAALMIGGLFQEIGGITFVRTIATDQQLAMMLVEELQNRGLDLTGSGKNGVHRDHVVLVAEWDTFYGRALPEIFSQVFRQKHNEGRSPDDPAYYPGDKALSWVSRVSYLRGLDGIVVGNKEGVDSRPPGGNKKDDANKMRLEEPLGRSQLDYLRRLADTIHQQHEELWRREKSGIRAVGILGSDFYDKYLVLQALKQRLPDVLFFTTDLDARFTHEMYSDWTRNLVVASAYNLMLSQEIQGDVPPFRDGYQTSVFLTILEALGGAEVSPLPGENRFPNLSPNLFEIGRTQAVDLGKPVGAFPFGTLFLVSLLLWACLTVLWLGCGTPSGQKWPAWYILLAWILVLGVAFFWHRGTQANPGEEPWRLLEGVSVLPSNLLRGLALFTSGFFFISAWLQLRRSATTLADEFQLKMVPAQMRGTQTPGQSGWLFLLGFLCPPVPAHEPQEKFTVTTYWRWYQSVSTLGWQVLRVVILLLVWAVLTSFPISYFGVPHDPVRGALSQWLNSWIKALAVVAFLILTFFVFDSTRLFRSFILQAVDRQPVWSLASYRRVLGDKAQPDSASADWLFISLVAKRSEVVNHLIYYPFIVWFILFASRWSLFDNWRLPLGLAIVISLSAVLAWSCALMLRRAAEKVRRQIVQRLKLALMQQQAAPEGDTSRVVRLRAMLEEVQSIRQGAFSPFFQNPVLQALFVPFGGIGGLTLLDFLNKLT